MSPDIPLVFGLVGALSALVFIAAVVAAAIFLPGFSRRR